MIAKIFGKSPTISKVSGANCIRIRLYQKYISKKLNIPSGARLKKRFVIPVWILKNRLFVIRYLRGLYEAEGSVGIHKPTSTYKLFFTNNNGSLRKIVFDQLIRLGFYPHVSGSDVQLSRKAEVEQCIKLLRFRKY